MKWKTIAEDYFTFSRPQRRSILIAIFIIIVCMAVRFGYSYFFSVKSIPADTAFLQEAERLTQPDTTKAYQYSRRTNYNDEANYNEPYKNDYAKKMHPKANCSPLTPTHWMQPAGNGWACGIKPLPPSKTIFQKVASSASRKILNAFMAFSPIRQNGCCLM